MKALLREPCKELNGLQGMLTDFDDWLCRYKQYYIRSSNVSATDDINIKTHTLTPKQLFVNSLLVNGYIHNKILLHNRDETKYKFVRDLYNGTPDVGCMLLISLCGVLYNAIYPGRIKKMVHIDPVPPLANYCLHEYEPSLWFKYTYEDYYNGYSKWSILRSRSFTYEEAVELIISKRGVNREQAELLLSRTLVAVDDGMYRFSWEPTMKRISGLPITEETLHNFIKLCPPTLNIVARDSITDINEKGVSLIKKFETTINNYHIVDVIGAHDVHVTNPDRFADVVTEFLNIEQIVKLNCKL